MTESISAGPSGPVAEGRLSTVFVYVRNLAEMVRFYRDILGFEVTYDETDDATFLAFPGSPRVELALYSGRADTSSVEPHWFYVIDVPDVVAAATALRDRGVSVGALEDVPYGRAATFSDPEGNVIEIHERK
ncbi:VOC family protein [Nesterenkonia ebinurensis]|uniref:VOC family protein n=1 Tax=Nesterenkonia ebinurensis TaxID=2608252 RepID=UPI00123DAE5B|nr:VOC family protein [Nesterenkonia ebinurensis]